MMQFSDRFVALKAAILRGMTPRWVLYAVVLLIGCQLVLLGWHLWLPSAIPPASLAKITPPQLKAANAEPLAKLPFTLFGRAATAPKTQAVTLRQAPVSALKLQLTGILASPIPEHSIAIIAKDNQQVSLGVGDGTPGYDAKIAAIFADRVVVNYQGRYESLLLFDEPKAAQAPTTAQHKVQLRKQSRDGQPQSMFNYLNISPVMVDNKLTGYHLNPGVQGALFEQVGLKENDLAVAINGLDLRDAQQAQKILQQLPQLSEVNLTIERDGQLQDIYIALGDN